MTGRLAYDLLRDSMRGLCDVPEELVGELFALSRLAHFRKGQVFLSEGAIPDRMGFNLNGIFRLYYVDAKGNELTKGFCTAGKFVVSYSAMVQHRPSFFSIEALSETDVLQFSYRSWMKRVEADGRWYPFLFKLLEAVYIMKEMREKSFLLDDAGKRYRDFLRDYPGLEKRIRLYHVASFLGITPEALSRLRRDLKLIHIKETGLRRR